jgi:hypothetical protein
LVVFGCLLLVEEQAVNGNAQRHFIEAQEKKLKRLDGKPVSDFWMLTGFPSETQARTGLRKRTHELLNR